MAIGGIQLRLALLVHYKYYNNKTFIICDALRTSQQIIIIVIKYYNTITRRRYCCDPDNRRYVARWTDTRRAIAQKANRVGRVCVRV